MKEYKDERIELMISVMNFANQSIEGGAPHLKFLIDFACDLLANLVLNVDKDGKKELIKIIENRLDYVLSKALKGDTSKCSRHQYEYKAVRGN